MRKNFYGFCQFQKRLKTTNDGLYYYEYYLEFTPIFKNKTKQ